MRLDAVSAQPVVVTGTASKPGTAAAKAPELPEGEVISARVLSVGDGTASLRTEDGALLQARLENGVTLTAGADVYLLVRESGSEVVVMSPVNPSLETAAAQLLHAQPADPFITEIFNQLVALGYEPTEEIMSAMRQLLTESPNLTMREAAFFAAQKLEAEPNILDAFRAVVSGDADTASLLDKLAAADILTTANMPQTVQAETTPPLEAVMISAEAATAIDTAVMPESPAMPETAAPLETVKQEGLIPAVITSADSTEAQVAAAETQAFASPANAPELEAPAFGRWLMEALGAVISAQENVVTVTHEALASSPLLDGLSERTLAGMAESLNRIADSIPKSSTETELFENIARFARELFVRLDGQDDADMGERLKNIREDLYIKLAYFRDAVASSGASAKDVLLEQTQKLMDHLRLLNGLDQFVCVQVPVQLEDRNANAELYIFKRKKNGRPQIDPENVKILLALDLTHMGKLETMIEILGRDVALRFEVENDDVARELRYNSARIHKLLEEAGYKFAGSTFAAKKSDSTIETALLTLLETERRHGHTDMLL